MPLEYGFKADDVITENKVTRSEIGTISEWAEERLDVPRLTEEQIVLFIIACERNLELTKKTVREFYQIRKNNKHLFDDRNVNNEDLQQQLECL